MSQESPVQPSTASSEELSGPKLRGQVATIINHLMLSIYTPPSKEVWATVCDELRRLSPDGKFGAYRINANNDLIVDGVVVPYDEAVTIRNEVWTSAIINNEQ